MKVFLGAGLMVIFIAIAVGISTFFGIVNADAFLHPQMAYRRVKLVVVGDKDPNAEKVIIHPEDGCNDPTPLKIIWSIRHQPDHWKHEYDAEFNNDPMSLWVGNGEEDLKIDGGWSYSDRCRVLLWKAFTQWQTNEADSAANKLTQ